jgi:hypothetical protein
VSKPLPLSPLSIVAATLPPFLCKSHAMSRLLSCGSISATWSICAGLTRAAARFAAARVPGAAAVGLLRYHRTARKVTTMNTSTWGTLMLCSAMTIREESSRVGEMGWDAVESCVPRCGVESAGVSREKDRLGRREGSALIHKILGFSFATGETLQNQYGDVSNVPHGWSLDVPDKSRRMADLRIAIVSRRVGPSPSIHAFAPSPQFAWALPAITLMLGCQSPRRPLVGSIVSRLVRVYRHLVTHEDNKTTNRR